MKYKKIYLNTIFLITLITQLNFSIIFVSSRQTFPDEFKEIYYIKYSFTQIFTHYEKGKFTAGGTIKMNINEILGDLNFSIDHQLTIWPRVCYEAYVFDYDIQYRVNSITRMIEFVDYYSEGFNGQSLKNNYVFYYIDTNIKEGDTRPILHDDMMIFRGAPFHSSTFRCVGVGKDEDKINIQGDFYDTIHMRYNVYEGDPIMVYTGSICGIGTGIGINATIDLYYEIKSGILLYSKSEYLEYYIYDSNIYQKHQIQRVILELNYYGEKGEGFKDKSPEQNLFWQDPQNRIGILSIIIILVGTTISLIIIHRKSIIWRYNTLRTIYDVENKLKLEIKQLIQEIDQEKKDLKNFGISI